MHPVINVIEYLFQKSNIVIIIINNNKVNNIDFSIPILEKLNLL